MMLIPLWLQRFLLQMLLNAVFGPNRLQMEATIEPESGMVKSFKAVVAKPVLPHIPSLITAPVKEVKDIASEIKEKYDAASGPKETAPAVVPTAIVPRKTVK